MFELTTGVFIFHFLEISFLPFMAEVRVSIPWTIVPDIFENDIYILFLQYLIVPPRYFLKA